MSSFPVYAAATSGVFPLTSGEFTSAPRLSSALVTSTGWLRYSIGLMVLGVILLLVSYLYQKYRAIIFEAGEEIQVSG